MVPRLTCRLEVVFEEEPKTFVAPPDTGTGFRARAITTVMAAILVLVTCGWSGTPLHIQAHGRIGTVVMQRLSAGSQFEEGNRPMQNINRSGPSEDRTAKIQQLMAGLTESGRLDAAQAMVAAKKADLDSMPMMDLDIEESHRSEIELAKTCAADMMRCGDVQGAITALKAMQPWLCASTDLGSTTLLDLAMALDAKRDPEARAIFVQLGRAPSEEVRSLAKMMVGVDEDEAFIKF